MCHQRVVASLVWGESPRAATIAHTRSRSTLGREAIAELLHGYTYGLHVPMGSRAHHFEEVLDRPYRHAREHGADRLDLLIGEPREIGQRAFAHFLALAVRLGYVGREVRFGTASMCMASQCTQESPSRPLNSRKNQPFADLNRAETRRNSGRPDGGKWKVAHIFPDTRAREEKTAKAPPASTFRDPGPGHGLRAAAHPEVVGAEFGTPFRPSRAS